MPSLQEMSGEKKFAPKLVLNEIRLNGQDGKFYYKNVLGGLKEVAGDVDMKERYEETELGDEVSLIFLKIRRKLVWFRKGKKSVVSNEHADKTSRITLYGDMVEVGTNDELRAKYPLLKTQQVVYAL